ncbi:MAG: tRNA (adenosine(37)-N6)-threonylcarbamoyltransferase complex transferase subunit TsaD [Candidatus Paceibacterota bacterium]|jgi:N6-L-threonylcarbamoyladenine synthase
MKILAIETSCDDTAISIVDVKGSLTKPVFKVLAHNISSQIKIHQEWGGVVPSLAKREHGKNLVPILVKSLGEAFGKGEGKEKKFEEKIEKKINKILEREPELKEQFFAVIPKLKIPKIDAIAVTKGPGLEPALWVGINFAKALALVWDKPLYPVNHLEGHILASLATPQKVAFPIISLIVSGGHTELVLSKDWLKYKIIGRTRDDAVGEAFDKVARILDLPYPGGPEISKLAATISTERPRLLVNPNSQLRGEASQFRLPRPMLHSGDFDFSFSGLKTAVLYLVQKLKQANKFDEKIKAEIAYEFQQAAIEVLVTKTLSAGQKFKAKTIIAGGGVIANTALREALSKMASVNNLKLLIPELSYSTDNATMIALSAGLRLLAGKSQKSNTFKADGNLNLK